MNNYRLLQLPLPEHQPHNKRVRVEDTNCGLLGVRRKGRLGDLLCHFITGGLFPTDPKHSSACVNDLPLPIIDESCAPVAEKQRRFLPQEVSMIRQKIYKMHERDIIYPSESPWTAQVFCNQKGGRCQEIIDDSFPDGPSSYPSTHYYSGP